MLRTLGYTILGGIVFCCAGLWLYSSGVASHFVQAHWVVRALLATLLVAVYTICGWATGLLLSLTHGVLRKVEQFEQSLQAYLDQRLAKLLAKIPLGKEGLAIADFKKLLDDSAREPATSANAEAPAPFSSMKIASRYLVRNSMRAMNAFFLQDFVEELEAQGQTHVNVTSVEKLGREKLLAFALDYLRTPVSFIRLLTIIVASLLLLLPVMVWMRANIF